MLSFIPLLNFFSLLRYSDESPNFHRVVVAKEGSRLCPRRRGGVKNTSGISVYPKSTAFNLVWDVNVQFPSCDPHEASYNLRDFISLGMKSFKFTLHSRAIPEIHPLVQRTCSRRRICEQRSASGNNRHKSNWLSCSYKAPRNKGNSSWIPKPYSTYVISGL